MSKVDVFILDDDSSTRRYLNSFFKSLKISSLEFESAQGMAEEIKSHNLPRICLIDINLSDKNLGEGFSLIKALRNKISNEVKIFAMSRRNSPMDIALALDNGADEYIQKPIDPINLQLQISRYINIKENWDSPRGHVPSSRKQIVIEDSLSLVEIGENHLVLESDFLILKKTKITLSNELISKITGREELKVFVNNNSKVPNANRYQIHVDLDSEDKELLINVKNWINQSA